MGLFDDLFGSKQTTTEKGTTATTSSANQTQTGTATQTNNTTQNQTSSGSTTSNTAQNQNTTGNVSTLDDASKAALQSLLGPLLQNASSGATNTGNSDALKAIADQFLNKSGTEAGLVQSATDAAVNKAKLDFQTGEGQQVNQVAQQIGSKGNTFSQQLSDKAQNDLLTQIAAITSSGALQASQLQNQDLQSAIQALVSGSQVAGQDASTTLAPLLQVISLLKGADTTTTQSTTGTGSTTATSNEQSVTDQIAQIIGSTTENTTQSGVQNVAANTTQGKKGSNGIINDILSIF